MAEFIVGIVVGNAIAWMVTVWTFRNQELRIMALEARAIWLDETIREMRRPKLEDKPTSPKKPWE